MTCRIKEYKVTGGRGVTPSARPIQCPEGWLGGRQPACRCDGGAAGGRKRPSLREQSGSLGHPLLWHPSEGSLILAKEEELHSPRDGCHLKAKRICVGQGGAASHPLPSSLPSGQLMTHLGSDFPPGAGVLDVMYESPSTLLSCGYDTYVRYWDLRTSVR